MTRWLRRAVLTAVLNAALHLFGLLLPALMILSVAGCSGPTRSPSAPQQSLRPVAPPPPVVKPATPSAKSRALSSYYADAQAESLARGLLRRDGGGPDTPFSAADLAENFERIAFYAEHHPGEGLSQASARPDMLRRWAGPVRMDIRFGNSVALAKRRTDTATLREYAPRLARLTRHPVSMVAQGGNFHVLVMGEDDMADALTRIRAMVPDISPRTLATLRHLPRDVHCLVLGFSADADTAVYGTSIALIRAEHPDLMRQACFHEELAQGLGLRNDSDAARPSIFNDDAEFALLTTQDEKMLQMLYDPRLRPGITLPEAHPIIQQIAAELIGGES